MPSKLLSFRNGRFLSQPRAIRPSHHNLRHFLMNMSDHSGKHRGYLSRALLFFVASLGLSAAVHAAQPYEAFLEKHCVRCHGPEKEKGDVRFDRLSRDFKLGADTDHWAEAMEQVNSGEMPPKKDKEPKPLPVVATPP